MATMPFPVLDMLMKHQLGDSGVKKLLDDWNKSRAEI